MTRGSKLSGRAKEGDVESERSGGLRSSPGRRDDSSQRCMGGAVATTT
jgi:hypothetical protein